MIKYNLNTIKDWNFGDDNIIKVYRNNAIVFYKVSGESPTPEYQVCFAVVDDISQYTDREFEDVYDNATEKWYKLNNLNQYEEYGIYGSGRTITTYDGKLTIDDGYEYEWNGSSWVNLGEVSGSSRVPQGYTEVEYIENTASGSNTSSTSRLAVKFEDSITNNESAYTYEITGELNVGNTSAYWDFCGNSYVQLQRADSGYGNKFESRAWGRQFNGNLAGTFISDIKYKIRIYQGVSDTYPICEITNITAETTNSYSMTATRSNMLNNSVKFGLFNFYNVSDGGAKIVKGKIYELKIYDRENNLLAHAIPCKRDSDGKVGFYNLARDEFEYDASGELTLIAGAETSSTEYPKYYSEKSEPLDNLTFNTLAEAQTYAYNNCVYDGMKATIGTDRYYFDSEDENGWVKILEYYKFEDVTPNQASGWTITGSATYNPQPSYYDDFSVALNSSYQTKVAKVTIYGYENFTYYLRSTGYSNYAYVTSSNVDELTAAPTSMSYNSSSAITNTYNFNKAAGSAVNLSNYRRVTYNNLDKTVEHTFYVVFYNGYYYSSYPPSATLLIPKEQTNENWEQVTFSASSNVASAQKSLYIDNNNLTSGGTQYWYYRWIVGLPSGSHSSYTNYSNYSYCPNATSSTFTSVASEQRQVNFTYDNTTDKTLSFRLTDGSGNVLTPSDTVYYSMTYYNSCGVSSLSSNVTFPRSQSVKVGGRFRFNSSSNRQYIYGYSLSISLNHDYYVDNYQSTFDITYTKLSDEAVTITYTTYDPSDVETPSFKTDITYPYSGGTTSSTTLTSYAVPYTYPYKVSQTSDKFSADSQSYTANQAARIINFVLYPNNREFATVADMEAYQYAWEGMKATVGDTKYQYKNGEWVENQHSLPDVPFTVNYNAKQYNASTKTLLKTEGQLADVDAVITEGTPTVNDGYLTIAANTRARISGYQNYFNRTNSTPNLTIISKQRTDGSNGHMFANRDSNYNWMYRCYSNKLTLHGTSEQGSVAVTTQPVIESVRVNSSRLLTYNNYTNNTSSTYSSFNYGSTNSTATALFAGYAYHSDEWFVGDFYWVYMCQGTLTDEQVQQVIDYNENL